MNVRSKVFGAALLALALSLALPALASSHGPTVPPNPWDKTGVSSHDWGISSQESGAPSHGKGNPFREPGTVLLNIIGLLGLAAAVVVTYKYPVAGTVPPTAQQAASSNICIAEVAWADIDPTALITHNMGLSTASGFPGGRPGIDQGFPVVSWSASGVSTIAAAVSFANTTGNVVTMTKGSILGNAGTIIVVVDRRQSIGR